MTPALLWALFILLLCGLPGDEFPDAHVIGFDKWVHAGVYSILALSLAIALRKQSKYRWVHYRLQLYTLVATVAYGVIIELFQGMVFVSRSTEVADMLANTAGCLIGCLSYRIFFGNLKH